MTRLPLVIAIAAAIVSAPALSRAQGSGRFLTGPIGWTPIISIRDAGVDSNIFDLPTDPKEDRVASIVGTLDSQITLAHFKVIGAASADYNYFQTFRSERSSGRRFTVRAEAPTHRFVPSGTASYERAKDRQGPEIDIRAQRTTRTMGAGIGVLFMTRGLVQIAGRREEARFDRGQVDRGVSLDERLSRDSDVANLAVRVNLTDLTRITVDAGIARDRFKFSRDQNTHNLTWGVAVEFEPDAVIRGRAGIGYHIIEPRGATAASTRSYTANVDLSYVLLERTRFSGRYFRDTAYSLEAPYYLSTTYGLDIAQAIGGPFELLARGNRQRSDYPENAALRLAHRIDLLDMVAGGLSIRMSETARTTITYELARRQSSMDQLRFDRRRIFTSLSYGF
jgi:hypothetical protein